MKIDTRQPGPGRKEGEVRKTLPCPVGEDECKRHVLGLFQVDRTFSMKEQALVISSAGHQLEEALNTQQPQRKLTGLTDPPAAYVFKGVVLAFGSKKTALRDQARTRIRKFGI